jgi:hypothetical protein
MALIVHSAAHNGDVILHREAVTTTGLHIQQVYMPLGILDPLLMRVFFQFPINTDTTVRSGHLL